MFVCFVYKLFRDHLDLHGLTHSFPTRLSSDITLDWPGTSKYSYTSFGSWSGSLPMGHNNGVVAYGIPTSAPDMPVTGSASYNGEIRGLTNGEQIGRAHV